MTPFTSDSVALAEQTDFNCHAVAADTIAGLNAVMIDGQRDRLPTTAGWLRSRPQSYKVSAR